ncbi:MAG: hypothetical protein M3R04_00180 [bacterium]|nr:hypothetical protein [bacterium]
MWKLLSILLAPIYVVLLGFLVSSIIALLRWLLWKVTGWDVANDDIKSQPLVFFAFGAASVIVLIPVSMLVHYVWRRSGFQLDERGVPTWYPFGGNPHKKHNDE